MPSYQAKTRKWYPVGMEDFLQLAIILYRSSGDAHTVPAMLERGALQPAGDHPVQVRPREIVQRVEKSWSDVSQAGSDGRNLRIRNLIRRQLNSRGFGCVAVTRCYTHMKGA